MVLRISIGSKICDTCRKKLSKEPTVFIPEPDSPSLEATEVELYVQSPEAVSSLKCLVELGETPYSQIKACGKYSRQKVLRYVKAASTPERTY